MAKKMRLEFTGFEEMAERLDQLGGNLKETTEKALRATHEYITPNIEDAFGSHDIKYSHATANSLKKETSVEWEGSVAEISVGFKISQGGLPSIFLMYGTPRIQPDKKLYNAIYGTKTKKEVKAIQEHVFLEEISKL